jgi:hypothetical protein
LLTPDLIAIYLDIHSYNHSYSLQKFTTHKTETFLLVRYHFTSYLLPAVCWCLTLDCSVSHLLKRILCRLSEVLSISVHENTSIVAQRLFVATRTIVYLCRYDGNTSVLCLGNDVTELSPLFRLSGRTTQYETYYTSWEKCSTFLVLK